MEQKHTREVLDVQNKITSASKEAAMHVRTCISWGQHVLTRSCRLAWQTKLFVLQLRLELHATQASLLQRKIELVDQVMELLEVEYTSSTKPQSPTSPGKKDFVIYSSFFKDPQDVITNPEVEWKARVLQKMMRVKRKTKIEHHRLRLTYQPDPLDRRVRRVKDILARLQPSAIPSCFHEVFTLFCIC